MQQHRTLTVEVDEQRLADGEVVLSASLTSDAPAMMPFGPEILDCRPESVDLKRAAHGLPLLLYHDKTRIAGRLFGVHADGRRVRASQIKLFDNQHGREARALLAGGHREMSIGYTVDKSKHEPGGVKRALRWTLLEASIVAIPADADVGVGRALNGITTMDNLTTPTTGAGDGADTNPMSRSQRRQAHTDVAAERSRSDAIARTGAAYSAYVNAEDVARAISEGHTIEQFNATIMRKMQSGATDTARTEAGLGPAYVRHAGDPYSRFAEFNVVRAIQAQVDPATYMRQAGFEAEISRELQRSSLLQTEGVLVPNEAFFRWGPGERERAMSVGTSSAGGSTVETAVLEAEWIDVLRARSVVFGLGARLWQGLTSPVAVPRKAAGTSVGWVTETGDVASTDLGTENLTLSPKRVGAFSEVSKQLLITSALQMESAIFQDLRVAQMHELDRVAMLGTGASNQPTGIANTAGIGSVAGGTDGALLTWSHILALESAVDDANGIENPVFAGYAINGSTRSYLKRTPKHATLSEGLIMGDERSDAQGFNTLNGYRAAVSSKLPKNLTKGSSGAVCSLLVFGDWSNLVVAMFGPGVEIIVDPYTKAKSGQVVLTANLFADVGVRHAASFATMADAKLA